MRSSKHSPVSRGKAIAIAAVIAAFAAALPFVCSEKLAETYYTFSSEKLTAPVKIAFLSDLHNTPYGEDMSGLIGSVDGFAPDAVIIGGDLFDYTYDEPYSIKLVNELVKKYPCYYALGNHETRYGDAETIRRNITAAGVTVLSMQNNVADLTVGGNTVRLMGIDGLLYSDQYERAKDAVSDKYYNILIDHYPDEFPKVSGDGFELMLAGHAHGGQVRIPGLINGLYAPDQGLFPKYTSGVYTENGSNMIVSRGLQRCIRDIIVPRVFNRPEAVYITLIPE